MLTKKKNELTKELFEKKKKELLEKLLYENIYRGKSFKNSKDDRKEDDIRIKPIKSKKLFTDIHDLEDRLILRQNFLLTKLQYDRLLEEDVEEKTKDIKNEQIRIELLSNNNTNLNIDLNKKIFYDKENDDDKGVHESTNIKTILWLFKWKSTIFIYLCIGLPALFIVSSLLVYFLIFKKRIRIMQNTIILSKSCSIDESYQTISKESNTYNTI